MKKLLFILLAVLFVITGCAKKSEETTQSTTSENKEVALEKLVVSATSDPHARILEAAKESLKSKGYELEIIELTDYYVFNRALNNKEVDANYFQHVPFFNDEVAAHNYNIVNAGGIHIEPFGFYSKTVTNLSDLKEGDTIIISNNVADQARILSILQKAGLIKLSENFHPITGTINDVVENKFVFKEIDPQLLISAYENSEGALVGINGNFALAANLNPGTDSILLEQADQTNPYVNIIATHKELENSEKIKALVEVLQSDEIKDFINKTWTNGAVIPAAK